MANPHLEDPLESEGIVMIDEIDLHLHPSWQKRVVGDLIRIFPNTQFILTTHSPYIIESINNHLKRAKLAHTVINNTEVAELEPVQLKKVQALLENGGAITPIMDQKTGLLNDTLLSVFNDINALYDIMRDIEWGTRVD